MTTRILASRPSDPCPVEITVEQLPTLLATPDAFVWVDMREPGPVERKILEEVFHVETATVEDLLADSPTPKLEHFEGYLYCVLQALAPGWDKTPDYDFRIVDLDVLLGTNFLVTCHECELPSVNTAMKTIQKKPDAFKKGPAYVAYLIADVLTERYLPLMERLDHQVDALETAIVKNPGPHLLHEIFELKRRLQRLRRIGLHQREVLARLSRPGDRESEMIPDEVRPFFRDAYDNFVRVVDLNDSLRDIVSSAMEAYLSMQGHKLNEIMKVLTLISTIMLPLTFIAGVYGMNFENMPELHWSYGYYGAMGAMGATAVAFVVYFKKKKWL